MSTVDDLRRDLDKDELDYPALAEQYGAAALPDLRSLVAEDEPRIASKAAYLAGLIAGPESHEVVALAAHSRHDVVRVSAASARPNLPTEQADQAAHIAELLLDDADSGVRARAVRSAIRLERPALSQRIRAMAESDPEPAVRDLVEGLAGLKS